MKTSVSMSQGIVWHPLRSASTSLIQVDCVGGDRIGGVAAKNFGCAGTGQEIAVGNEAGDCPPILEDLNAAAVLDLAEKFAEVLSHAACARLSHDRKIHGCACPAIEDEL